MTQFNKENNAHIAMIDSAKKTAKPKRKEDSCKNNPSNYQKTILLESIKRLELFNDTSGTSYARVNPQSPEVIPIDSDQFKHFLDFQYFKKTDSGCSSKFMTDIINTAVAQARYCGKPIHVYSRIAHIDNKLYVDLANKDNQVIEIDENGWTLATQHSVFFIRSQYMQAMPVPTKQDDTLDQLWKLVNLKHQDRVLIFAWMLSCFCQLPHPILMLHGQQGSGKSTLTKILKSIVDPNDCDTNFTPRDERDLIAFARGNHVLAIDNNSYINSNLSDHLCRFSSGGAVSLRKLYKNAEEVVYHFCKPIILNGINNNIIRGDLLERSIIIELPCVPGCNRITEQTLFNELRSLLPGLLGTICDHLVFALRPHTPCDDLPRMADFYQWICAALSESHAFSCQEFTDSYFNNKQTAMFDMVEDHPVGMALVDLAKSEKHWAGTALDLLQQLNRSLKHRDQQTSKLWPKDCRTLGKILDRLKPLLSAHGITLRKHRSNGARIISIEFNDPNDPIH